MHTHTRTHAHTWVLHIAKVGNFFSPSLPNVEGLILEPLPFFFYQKSFIFHFLENFFAGPNLHNAVGKINMLICFEIATTITTNFSL